MVNMLEEIIEELQVYYRVKRELARDLYKRKANIQLANVWRLESRKIKREIEYLESIKDKLMENENV